MKVTFALANPSGPVNVRAVKKAERALKDLGLVFDTGAELRNGKATVIVWHLGELQAALGSNVRVDPTRVPEIPTGD